MIEHFCVFTKSGIVLWHYSPTSLRGSPVNEFIKTILLEERSGQDIFLYEGVYALKWTLANDSDLVFVVVYQKMLPLTYLDDLLIAVKKRFTDIFGPNFKIFGQSYSFDKEFENLYKQSQNQATKPKVVKAPRPFAETKKGMEMGKEKGKDSGKEKGKENGKEKGKTPKNDTSIINDPVPAENPQIVPEPVISNVQVPIKGTPQGDTPTKNKMKIPVTKTASGMRLPNKHRGGRSKVTTTTEPEPGTKRSKAPRKWDSADDSGNLNFSPSFDVAPEPSGSSADTYGAGDQIDLNYDNSGDSESSEGSEVPETQQPKKNTGLLQFFHNMINKELTEADLDPVLKQFKDHLITKNVATEIAEKLCASVSQSLLGKQLSTFSRVSTTVGTAMEEALTRILTPKHSIDVLRAARSAKSQRRPYVIVFVGVNGVGKSTSLSKVCSWFLQNGMKVIIAGCDTFRAGAVEQLQVHANNLEVPLFHRGYGKDPASVAQEAILKATREQIDVVLVDTAGRMQDNEPLMRALAKLVGVNEPDLVLFVGEALVGNEAVDQLTKFNRSLEEYSTSKNPRGIDGIFLTKFDTVDEKVGAAISMVYTTGQPIVFVGIGQKYSDLKVLNVPRLVSVLLKGR